jgi:outer membrane protein assembly factor BamB
MPDVSIGVTTMRTNVPPPLRVWPGVMLAVATVAAFVAGPVLLADAELPVGLIALLLGAAGILLWWLCFSRVPWAERVGAVGLAVVLALVVRPLTHLSIAGAGQGAFVYILAAPLLMLGLVAWAVIAVRLDTTARRVALPLVLALACAPLVLIRTAGVTSTALIGFAFHWRWSPTPEEILLATAEAEPLVPAPPGATGPVPAPPAPTVASPEPAVVPDDEGRTPVPVPAETSAATAPRDMEAPLTDGPAEWPGFRGPDRNGVVANLRIGTDWAIAPPAEMWSRPIGPGWSSFAVHGDLLYTQEQRGGEEIVACYRVSTGQPVWRHADGVRFYESNGGAGPRATPALHGDQVFAHGATGILNALDARTGRLVWTRNVAADTNRRVPDWGFASSPLVVDDVVIVAAAGTLVAYDLADGQPRWQGPSYGGSYSSPHRVTIEGVEQVVLLGGPGAISVAPDDGRVNWEHRWEPGPIVQPAVTADGDLIVNALTSTGGSGTRRLHVSRGAGGWTVDERWTSNGLKPYFNDLVIHDGHAYGFDNNILSSIDLATGQRNWKGGRYGNGQMVLLPEQHLLLVLSEDGELALVSATPDKYTEFARVPALDGKTWNHPAIVGDVLLIRNGEQMKAFRLPRSPDAVGTAPDHR